MIRSLILALAFQFVTPVWATEGLIPNADITTESEEVAKIEGFVDQLEKIESPSFPDYVNPEDPITNLEDFKSGSGQELFIYGMMTAMVERADRENLYCQKDLDAGYKPCRFGSIKPRDHYAKAWLDAYNSLQVKNKESLARLASGTICPENTFYATSFPDGSPLCAPAPSLQEMENHRFSCAVNVSEYTIALDSLFAKKYNSRYPIYEYWNLYPQCALQSCPRGSLWGAGEFGNIFKDFIEASVDHWHCNEYLRQLKDLYERESFIGLNVCTDQGPMKDGSGGFLWKAVADPKARCKNGTTILLAKDQFAIKDIELLDANQSFIFKPAYYGLLSDGRPRFCAEGRPGLSFKGPLLVKYGANCKTVVNPANRED